MQQFSVDSEDTKSSLTRRDYQEKRELIAAKRDAWLAEKRDLTGRGNDTTIDPFYGCFIYDELLDYATNFSIPWSEYFPPFASEGNWHGILMNCDRSDP